MIHDEYVSQSKSDKSMYCTKLYCLLTLKNVSLPVTKSIFVSSLLKWKEISNYKISVTEFFFFERKEMKETAAGAS